MDYRRGLQEYLNRESINTIMNVLEDARKEGRKIFICGNGGSAATASHYCCDFNKGVSETLEKKYNMECLNDNIPGLMAVANDIGYEEIFRYPLRNKMKKGDLLIGISGSGNSENVIYAMNYAKSTGGKTIAIVGFHGGRMKEIADYSIHIEVDNMQIAEDIHMIVDHLMMYVLTHNCITS